MAMLWTRFKRNVYLIHRWTGVAACCLMALWFVSGAVMLFVGYPKLMPAQRLARLPVLAAAGCCIPVSQALLRAGASAAPREITLTSIAGSPYYRLRQADGRYVVVDAVAGMPGQPAGEQRAMLAARAFIPGAAARYLGPVDEDRWTHAASLNPHRPLHRIQMGDAARTLLYISSSTGEPVMAAPLRQRAWNYVGAWLHWLYMFRDRPADPGWSWIVIGLSGAGVITALTGTLAGLWRWRFGRPYKSGSRSPYREGWLRWHHLSGLVFAAIVCAWIFSGLMSMNPLGIFSPKGQRPDLAAYQGGTPDTARLALEAPEALAMLESAGFHAREIEWRVLGGMPYLLARDAANETRLILRDAAGPAVRAQWPDSVLLEAAPRLINAAITSQRRLLRYDSYYYRRSAASMYGAAERRLPVLRVSFDDPDRTWAYLDPYTGDLELSSSRSQRTGRWLFNFLHSWDLPPMLRAEPARHAALILLSLGGLVLSISGIGIGYMRLRAWAAKASHKAGAFLR